MKTAIIAGAARTPIGGFQGALAPASAPALGGIAMRAALERSGAGADRVDEVHMGCVLPAGLGQAPARQAAFRADIGERTPAVTINKMCGSGMQAVMTAHDRIALGRAAIAVAGGMESMTNAPYLLPRLRGGARMGHTDAKDHMFLDGLEDAYEPGRLMGTYAEDLAESRGFGREDQDRFATLSLSRAAEAIESGAFDAEIHPVPVESRKETRIVSRDEQPPAADPDRIPRLRPAFREGGTVTAANSSSISDGAAALVIAEEGAARERGMPILARIAGQFSAAQAPRLFTTSPILAVRGLLEEVSWSIGDVDVWEVNEAFAVVAMAFMRELDIPEDKVNIRGGACALGHPIGASGARILVTLLHIMQQRDLKKGVAAICIGGGEATAMAIERA